MLFNINGVIFNKAEKVKLTDVCENREVRFLKSKSIPGIRSFYQFNDFILWHFDSFYWIGMTEENNFVEKDVKIKFMHPHDFTQLYFPTTADDCCIPVTTYYFPMKRRPP